MATIARRLLTWFDRHQRDLPWRQTRDPWAIWVSEIMLQQTRVETVRHAYVRFMGRYPTPEAFARATDDQLLTAWKGRGGSSRARLLREGARAVVSEHDGVVPSTRDELAKLPGIGAYTSGAIASIAFDERVPAIDGNVERVVARHEALRENVKTGPGARQVRDLVTGWIPEQRAGDFNQAVMELGATVCTPRNPQCEACPIAGDCRAESLGIQAELPVLPIRKAAVEVVARAVLVPISGARVLASRIQSDRINGGQVDLPGAGPLVPMVETSEFEEALNRAYGVAFQVGEVVTTVRHTITHHRIRLLIHRATCAHGPGPNLMAVRPDDTSVPWTSTARKAFRQAALFLTAHPDERT